VLTIVLFLQKGNTKEEVIKKILRDQKIAKIGTRSKNIIVYNSKRMLL
jgi:hypothetical protein